MRRTIALSIVILITSATGALALDAFPKTTLAELGVASWCTYCPQAYQGINVVHANYDATEVVSIRYYTTSSGGLYGNADTNAALAYYGISSYPTAIFNGTTRVGGGGTEVATGLPYMAVVAAPYFEPSPIQIEITSFDPVSGATQAVITMHSATASLDNDLLRFVLVEDNLGGIYTHAARDIVNDTITLTGQGNTATVDHTFVVDPSWVTANLWAAVFVQRAATREVVQVASTYPAPTTNVRAMVPSSRMQIGPSSGYYEADPFTVMNTGAGTESFTINVVVDEAPLGWNVTFCDVHGGCHVGPYDFDLAAGATTDFHATVIPSAPGAMRYHFEITADNLTPDLVVPFAFFTDDLDVLIVDDDGGEDFDEYFSAALDAAGKTSGVWDRSASALTAEAAQNFPVMVWNVGWSFPSLDPTDRTFLTQYLAAGNSLFVTGQDIGWDLNTTDSGNYDPTFYHDVLHANYLSDDTNILYLDGVAADPITDGLALHIDGGDGASNQEYPSAIAPRDAAATSILTYTSAAVGAIRAEDSVSGAKLVYLAFGFEGIDNPTDRAALLGAAVDWLTPTVPTLFTDGFESGDTTAWSATTP